MYIASSDDVYKIANFLNAETHVKGNELFFKVCPYCHGGSHGKDYHSFSINLQSGAFKCFRASCGRQGHLVELARDFNFDLEPAKTFKQLPQKVEIRNEAMEYMASRGISNAVAKSYQITTQKDNPKVIVFPFFDENGILRFVKYRNAAFQKGINKSKEWCEKDCMPILFGMNLCVDFEQVIITEGQIDSLSVSEAGIRNAVSVPTGAKGFTWLAYCGEWLKKFKRIIVFGDMENGHMSLLDELRMKLPTSQVWNVKKTHYLGCKDANEILTKFGAEAVRKAVEECEIADVSCVKQLADVQDVDLSKLPRIPFRIKDLDKVLEGLIMSQVYVISGKSGEGKSTFASQVIATALTGGKRCFAYSGELPNHLFKAWLDFQLAGGEKIQSTINEFGNEVFYLPEKDRRTISDWYRDRMFIYDNSFVEDDEEMELLAIIEQVIVKYSIDVILVDNLMTAVEADSDNIYHKQSKFINSLCKLAKKYDVAIILIAHPRKTAKGASFSNDEVAGTSNVTNRVDVIMNYERNSKKKDDCDADGLISVTKNRLTGRLTGENKIEVFYSRKSKRIYGRDADVKNDIFNKSSETYVAPF